MRSRITRSSCHSRRTDASNCDFARTAFARYAAAPMARAKNPPPIQAMALTRWGVSQVQATTTRQPMKTANRPQMAAIADARNSAAISRCALAKSKLARSTYATRCRSSAGVAFANIVVSRAGDVLRVLPYGLGPLRQALLRRINRALNFASHSHHVRVFQIHDPRHELFNVCDQVLDLARSSRLDMVHAFAQIVLEATSGRTSLLSGSVVCSFHLLSPREHRDSITGIVAAAEELRHRLRLALPVGIAPHAKLWGYSAEDHMKILGEELGEIGRWYIALPPLLLIGFLIGLFFLAAAGQSRLNTANERVHDSQLRQQALSEFIALISDAESGQRGYLLTGESSYLQPYTEAVAKVEAALDRVHEAYGGNDDSREFQELRILTGKKLGELEDTLALFMRRGTTPAVNVVRTDVGKHTMDEISRIVGDMRLAEARELAAATAQWQRDFQVSRWVSAVGVILNISLVLLATHLVYGDMRRRARQAINLRDQKQELEREVDEQPREMTALSTHLQGVSEQEKSALSRELHDELGGLLVAARMDLSWLQQRLPTSDPAIDQRFKRIHDSLSAGVDLKRRVVEELRPTLLDNMGLFTALRWQ